MDHLSSSSSSTTGTTTYIPQSLGTFPQDVPKQTYTTAGTIYNPNNAQPLQPPVRRGRNLKWPPSGGATSELSLFPKSVLAGLPLKSQNQCSAPTSPVPNQIPKYSPLQQNYDRAVSPVTDHSRESPNDLDNQRVSSPMPYPGMNNKRASPVAAAMPVSVVDKHADADSSADEDEDGASEKPLKGLTVKSLHNLASYPNPNQKKAQRALLRVRPGVTPVPFDGTNGSRSTTPAFGALSFEASDMGNDGSHSPSLFRSAKTSPTDVLKPQEPRPARDLTGSWRTGTKGITSPPGLFPANNVQRSSQGGAYKSTLATGPGAPLPLTAGPPGQRQHRTSTLESTMNALHSASKTDVSSDDSMAGDLRSGLPGLHKNATYDLPRPSGSATLDHLKAGSSIPLHHRMPEDRGGTSSLRKTFEGHIGLRDILQIFRRRVNITDTKTREEVKEYYPDGLPLFGIPGPSDDWPKNHRPNLKPGTSYLADDELKRHNERINRLFHAGTGELGRSMEAVIRDAEFRQFKREVGVIGDRRPKSKPEKVEYPPISIQQANNMTAKEAADPFVTMTFSSLLNHAEGGIKHESFHQWQDPAPSLVDQSEKGRQTVFGN